MIILALLLMQVTTPPAAFASPPPGWTALPLEGKELANYTRTESDGSVAQLIVTRQVCNCQPALMNDTIERMVRQNQGVTVTRDEPEVCGQKASSILVTGLAPSQGKKNILRVAFRSGNALVTQVYMFTRPQPAPDAIATVEGLCPAPSPPQP